MKCFMSTTRLPSCVSGPDHFCTDGSLDGHIILLPGNELLEFFAETTSEIIGVIPCNER